MRDERRWRDERCPQDGWQPGATAPHPQGDLTTFSPGPQESARGGYANATAFADDLRRYLNLEPVTARPDTITYRVGKFVRHRAGSERP
jgi:serine/threonine-protein kinase